MPNIFEDPNLGMDLVQPQPQQAASAPAAPAQSNGGFNVLEEAFNAIIGGGRDALQETLDFTHDAGQFLEENVLSLGTIGGGEVADENPIQLPDTGETETVVGGVAKAVTQFGVGMLGASKFTAPIRIAKVSTRGNQLIRAVGAGALTDAVAFDPFEQRLSNLVESVPELQNPLTEALAADPEDTAWEGRLKNVVEGAALGAAADVLVAGVRHLRGYRAAKKQGKQAAAEYIDQATPDLEATVRGATMSDEAFDAAFGRAPEGTQPFNRETFAQQEGVIDRVEKAYADAADELKARDRRESLKTTAEKAAREYADIMDMSPEEATAIFSSRAESVEDLATHLVAGKKVIANEASEIVDLATRYRTTRDPSLGQELVDRMATLGDHAARVKMIQTEAARATSAGRIRVDDVQDIAARAGDDPDQLAEMIAASEGNLKALTRIAKGKSWQRQGIEMVQEYWINSLLSSPKTHLVNLTSNIVNMLITPLERGLGAATMFDTGGMREAIDHFAGLHKAMMDSLRLAKDAFIAEENILDPQQMINDVTARRTFGNNGGLLGMLGQAVRLPSRFLLAEDEWAKQMTYRATVYSRAMREARNTGLRGKDAVAYAEEQLDAAFNRATGEGTDASGISLAREATFTQELGDFGQWIQQGTHKLPVLKFIAPFVRTPTNIIKQAWFRTPGLNALSSEYRAALNSSDPVARQMARGRMVTGSAIAVSAVSLAAGGQITGRGPEDPDLRQRMVDSGWRPYSIKVGDKWVDMRRLEPFSIPFATVADAVELHGGMDDMETNEIVSGIVLGFTRNVTSKTYLKGVIDMINAISDPERYGERWLQSFTSGFVPYSAGLQSWAAVVDKDDPYFREIDGVLDAIRAKVPGFSEDLPARRNWMTGEKIGPEAIGIPERITPIPIREGTENLGAKYLVEMGYEGGAPRREVKGVDLSTSQYSRLLHLHGQMKIRGQTMMDRIEADIGRARAEGRSHEYQKKLVDRIVTVYRDSAKLQLMREDPGLEANVRDRMRDEALALIGGASE